MKASRYDHVIPILDLETLHWLPVRYRIQYKIILTMYKASHLLALSYLSYLLEFYRPIRTLRSSSESPLVVHRAHLRQFGDRAFCIAAPHLRNRSFHAICEHVIHYRSSKDSLKLIYSKELFTHEHYIDGRFNFLGFTYLVIILSYF